MCIVRFSLPSHAIRPERWFTLVVVLFALLNQAEADERPNILFIYTDDHSHRTVGCYDESYEFVRTPNIDRLASDGVRFRYAYMGTWCMPSRATMLTGHYQHAVKSMRMEGDYPGSEYDPEQCPFWPKVFRANGYQTAQIGKWHTGTDTGFGRDWDYQIVWNRPRHPKNAGNYYKDQLIEFQGGDARNVTGYSTDNYTRWAVEYLQGKGREPDKPWYLWLCYGAVHGPFTPADRHLDEYANVSVPVPQDIFPPRAGKPAYMQEIESWYRGKDGLPHLKGRRRATGENSPGQGIHGSSLDHWIRQYHQGVLALDEAVGKLIATLKETGQYDNTLIVFTSDQGFAWGQHGFRAKVAPYDANIRSPLILSMPKRFPRGKVCTTPAGGVDIAPTFFDLAGIDLPWKMHGRSLVPQLEKPEDSWRRNLLMTFTGRHYGTDTDTIPTDTSVLRRVGGVSWYASLHDGRFKYIRTFEENEIEELYDLQTDPEELNNLASNDDHAAHLHTMRGQTIAELRRTDAGFVDALPKVRP
ncbi:MAG: sulfatase-like hydrolase/transferase [Pirellulaceae bacterium]